MDLKSPMLSKINLTEKDKCCMIPLICGFEKSYMYRNREWNGGCQGLGAGKLGRGWSKGTLPVKMWGLMSSVWPVVNYTLLCP